MIAFRCWSEVSRYSLKAWVAIAGNNAISESARPVRVRTGVFVTGEMVVITSVDMLLVSSESPQNRGSQ